LLRIHDHPEIKAIFIFLNSTRSIKFGVHTESAYFKAISVVLTVVLAFLSPEMW